MPEEFNAPSFGAEINNLPPQADYATQAFVSKLERRKAEFEIGRDEDEHSARKWLIDATFIVTVCWLIVVICIFVYYGKGELYYPDTVIITFITTTTVNTLAFLAIIFKYLFTRKDNPQPPTD